MNFDFMNPKSVAARRLTLFVYYFPVLLIPIAAPLLKSGDDLAGIFRAAADILPGDILAISSKAVATVEGAMIDLRTLEPSPPADDLSGRTGRSARFCEAMLRELDRLNGRIIGAVNGAALTEVKPSLVRQRCSRATRDDRHYWSILVANAGLDESNVPEGFAIGWPRDPVASVRKLRKELEKRIKRNKGDKGHKRYERIAIILTDSCCAPRRSGVTAFALAASGIDPLQSQKGRKDLFGRPLSITVEAVADQLATAANFLMGNAEQAIPAVIIRDHGLALSDWEGWVPGIESAEDLFGGILN